MKTQLAIILTSIARPNLLKKSLQSIVDNWPKSLHPTLMVGNQDGWISETSKVIEEIKADNPDKRINHYIQDYDCGLCLDKKTEILTNNGWKSYHNINKTDMALSLNPKSNIANYYPIANIYINKAYNDKMYLYEGKNVNFCVTPNHNMWIKNNISTNIWKFQEIQKIDVANYLIRQCFGWIGENKQVFVLPKLSVTEKRKKNRHIRNINMNDWLEFLGWYISEGSLAIRIKDGHYRVSISQKQETYKNEIVSLLNKLKLNWNYSSNSFNIHDKQICEWLKNNCYSGNKIKIKSKLNCYNKIVPTFIKSLSPNLIRIFLESYRKGDGHLEPCGRIRYITSSKKLANDIQELILKTGKYASLDKIKPKTFIIDGRKINPQKFHYKINEHISTNYPLVFNKKLRNCAIIKKIDYNGVVWCINVEPHNLIYIRRNGKCCWTGNSKARNQLITYANILKCTHVLLTADSIMFEDMEDLGFIIHQMEKEGYSRVGLNLNNRIPWEANLKLISGDSFEIDFIDPKEKEKHLFVPCDIVRNFHLSTTESMVKVGYDNDLIMAEHEDEALRYKDAGYKVACTNMCSGLYVKEQNNEEYDRIRRTNFAIGIGRLKNKYSLKSWVSYLHLERTKNEN